MPSISPVPTGHATPSPARLSTSNGARFVGNGSILPALSCWCFGPAKRLPGNSLPRIHQPTDTCRRHPLCRRPLHPLYQSPIFLQQFSSCLRSKIRGPADFHANGPWYLCSIFSDFPPVAIARLFSRSSPSVSPHHLRLSPSPFGPPALKILQTRNSPVLSSSIAHSATCRSEKIEERTPGLTASRPSGATTFPIRSPSSSCSRFAYIICKPGIL
ncbi:hypothetical protein J3F83DRAFT_587525 [Trichoderma novae-zelandiae]